MSVDILKSQAIQKFQLTHSKLSDFMLHNPLESVFLSGVVILDYNTKSVPEETKARTSLWKFMLPAGLILGTLAATYPGVSGLFRTTDTASIHLIAWSLAMAVIASLTVSGGFLAFATHELGTD